MFINHYTCYQVLQNCVMNAKQVLKEISLKILVNVQHKILMTTDLKILTFNSNANL